ncbi:ribosomal protein-like protein S15 [Tricladium varicosporioides]|nr:ribosomal protein-like protein S15 [Hymenoscyphus varicosporioides]
MPPRIPIPSRLSGSSLCFRPAPSKAPLPFTQSANASTFAERKAHKDPYALAQSAQRKAVNLARQKVLQEERKKALGDPVRGITTPFVESFDDVGGSSVIFDTTEPTANYAEPIQIKTTDSVYLNHFLKPEELANAVQHSYSLSKPLREKIAAHVDPMTEDKERVKHEKGHLNATRALARIVSLANSGQKDKTRANIQRCIETFGRHKTDVTLQPRAPINPNVTGGVPLPEKTPRAGPDTGSSEVQIAILTAKIRVLANQLEKKGGNKDKINKRNLRVMVHKRQKHLNYLRRKERGSDRWQNLVKTLGLTEGTYKGEISL